MQAFALPIQDQIGVAIERGRALIDDAQIGRRVRTATGRVLRELPDPPRRKASRRRPILVGLLVAVASAVGVALLMAISREWTSQFLAPGSAGHLHRLPGPASTTDVDVAEDLQPDVESPAVVFMTAQLAEMGTGPGLEF